jgi:hypothetical protein
MMFSMVLGICIENKIIKDQGENFWNDVWSLNEN